MRHGFGGVAALVEGRIAVDIVDAVLGENALTAAVLRLNRDHSALDLIAGQVRDGANHMRETVEQVRHAAALIVDDKESDILGTVVDRKRENISLQGFGFAGTGRTGNQTVRAVIFLVNVQITGRVAATETD